MKDMDEQDIKTRIDEISNKIDDIIQKVNEREPGADESDGDDHEPAD